MIKETKFLKLCTDKDVISSTKAPEPIDEWDGSCPACGSTQYHEKVTIMQHGFLEDSCVTVVQCATCHEAFHYYYQIDANILEMIMPSNLRPPTGG